MSHYTVAVFHRKDQDVDELLAPYSENLKVEPYISFSRREAIEYARKHYKGYEDKTDEECWQFMADNAGDGMTGTSTAPIILIANGTGTQKAEDGEASLRLVDSIRIPPR